MRFAAPPSLRLEEAVSLAMCCWTQAVRDLLTVRFLPVVPHKRRTGTCSTTNLTFHGSRPPASSIQKLYSNYCIDAYSSGVPVGTLPCCCLDYWCHMALFYLQRTWKWSTSSIPKNLVVLACPHFISPLLHPRLQAREYVWDFQAPCQYSWGCSKSSTDPELWDRQRW